MAGELQLITITGADDGVDEHGREQIRELAAANPWVEWAILHSSTRSGSSRYPSANWVYRFTKGSDRKPRLAAHFCGRSMRAFLSGDRGSWAMFSECGRMQFNGCRMVRERDAAARALQTFVEFREEVGSPIEFIMQEDSRFAFDLRARGIPAVCLYDRSGGRGVRPEQWPLAFPSNEVGFVPTTKAQRRAARLMAGPMPGYAGGLNPENVAAELPKIAEAASPFDFWIDVETGVRDENDRFDLGRVEAFIEACRPFVKGQAGTVRQC